MAHPSFMLEKFSEMPLTARERKELLDFDIEINGRIRLSKILVQGKRITWIETIKVELPEGKEFAPVNVCNIPGSESTSSGFSAVVISIGMRSAMPRGPT